MLIYFTFQMPTSRARNGVELHAISEFRIVLSC
jgi:hypothetical protein